MKLNIFQRETGTFYSTLDFGKGAHSFIHFYSLKKLTYATIPFTKPCGESGRIPGWSEFVAPLKNQSVFWHNLWSDCGKPHNGVVADIMRKSRARYHAAIRQVRKDNVEIVNNRTATALSLNKNRDFWSEIKRIRHNRSVVGGVVDGFCSSSDIADVFANKYQDLYTSVPYDVEELQSIRNDLNASIFNYSFFPAPIINVHDVGNVINGLKTGKADGSSGLSSDHFINAGSEFAVHVSMLFSALLVHGCAPADMCACTIVPIPKGKNANIGDSSNYRGISLCSVFVCQVV